MLNIKNPFPHFYYYYYSLSVAVGLALEGYQLQLIKKDRPSGRAAN